MLELALYHIPQNTSIQLPDGTWKSSYNVVIINDDTFVNHDKSIFSTAEDNDGQRTSTSPTKTVSNTLTEFRLFPQLPSELRHQIWNHTIRRPRLIELRTTTEPSHPLTIVYTSPPSPSTSPTIWQCMTPPHPALSTTHESRSLALDHFEITLPIHHFPKNHTITSPLYMSPYTDILYPNISHEQHIATLLTLIPTLSPTASPLSNLAINLGRFNFYPEYMLSLPHLTSLKTLYLTIEAECEDGPYQCLAEEWIGNARFVTPETEGELRAWEGWTRAARCYLEFSKMDLSELKVMFPAVRRGGMKEEVEDWVTVFDLEGPCGEDAWNRQG